MIITMPPTRNPLLEANFSERPGPAGSKYPILACNHCKWARTNTRRALEHLGNCPGYKPPELSVRPAKRQQTLQLGVQSIPHAKKQKLDSAAALAVYIGARPFRLWEDKYIQAFLGLLSDYLYIPPHRNTISGDLLDQTYLEVQHKVLSILDKQDTLQFVLDETPDINYRRIVNLSVVIPRFGSFYLENENVGDRALNSMFFMD
jgi:hypothetical protein